MNLRRNLKKGETVFSQRSPSDYTFIINSGSVQIIETTPSNIKKTNEIFLEMRLIDGQPHPAAVKALSKNKFTVLTQECFNSLKDLNLQALMLLLKVLTARVQEVFRLANLQNP
jgi:CRP-like cAMP-binding protein